MQEYQVCTLHNFREIAQVKNHLSEPEKREIEVVGNVLPFKANNYVIEKLIDWSNYQDDPIYTLTFPRKRMLQNHHFQEMESALRNGLTKAEIKLIANKIRWELNPHPAGQRKQNIPEIDGIKMTGLQHKYQQTVLFFPSSGQTCHAYCTFCFRWPQFTGMREIKFALNDAQLLVQYIRAHPEITDLLITGGDPLIMRTKVLRKYLDVLLEADIPHLKTIRLGSKSLSYWPQRFLTEPDADDLLRLFEKIVNKGIHLAFMAHFNHPNEFNTKIAESAIRKILGTGAQIRTQSPIMKHINNDPVVWSEMWQRQVELGCFPYYMFMARDTGAQHYFAVTLEKAWEIFQKAYTRVSGIARTVRGPSMSAGPGKVQILGMSQLDRDKVFVLQFIQGRNPDWVNRPFFAKYDPNAIWLNELEPALGKSQFFFENEYPLNRKIKSKVPNTLHTRFAEAI